MRYQVDWGPIKTIEDLKLLSDAIKNSESASKEIGNFVIPHIDWGFVCESALIAMKSSDPPPIQASWTLTFSLIEVRLW